MKSAHLIFPHQLFRKPSWLEKDVSVYLIEEYLFFNQLPFHKQKIAFHRASMKAYESYLHSLGYEVHYVEAIEKRSDVRVLIAELTEQEVKELSFVDPTDCWLEKRIEASCLQYHISFNKVSS